MRLKELKNIMLIPDREILLNRVVSTEDTEMLLVSITSENGTHKLWTLRQLPEQPEGEEEMIHEAEMFFSNREIIQRELQAHTNFGVEERFLSQIIIQGQPMTFSSSESTYFRHHDYGTYMKFQHFIEKGLRLGSFADVELDRLVLTSYEQGHSDKQEDHFESFPDLDLEQELDITLTFSSTVCRIPIHTEPIVLEFEHSQSDIKYSFYDSFSKQNRFFYVSVWNRYDIWEKTKKTFENPIPEEFTKEEWERLKEQQLESTQSMCSRDQVLALVEYESEDNLQLNFYAQDYLDAKPVFSSSMSSIALLFASDQEFGPHGLKSRIDSIGPVDQAFEENIVVELLSYYVELPEKIVKPSYITST